MTLLVKLVRVLREIQTYSVRFLTVFHIWSLLPCFESRFVLDPISMASMDPYSDNKTDADKHNLMSYYEYCSLPVVQPKRKRFSLAASMLCFINEN